MSSGFTVAEEALFEKTGGAVLRALRHADGETTASILKTLTFISNNEAVDVLAKSAGSPQLDDVLKGSLRSYLYDRESTDSSFPGITLTKLLENTSTFGSGGLRVCDIVLGILANIDIPGHPGLPLSGSLADRDAKLAEWIVYLQERPIPSDYEDDDHGFGRLGAPSGLSAPAIPRMRSDEE